MTLQQVLEAARSLSEADRRRLMEELLRDSVRPEAATPAPSLLGLWESDDAVVEQMLEELMTERETRHLRA